VNHLSVITTNLFQGGAENAMRPNVAVPVPMTICSTPGAIVMTLLLTKWQAGQYVAQVAAKEKL
jgi:hypothetical protein